MRHRPQRYLAIFIKEFDIWVERYLAVFSDDLAVFGGGGVRARAG